MNEAKMTDTQAINLRVATEEDVRSMTIIRLSNHSSFAKVLFGLEDCSSTPDSVIEEHERDIRKRIASRNAIAMVATIRNPASAEDEVAGWAMWKAFDEPQSLEPETSPYDGVTENAGTDLSKLFQADFKTALVKGRNAHTSGRCNIRLCNLFTHPLYHRRGIGGMLLGFGTALADKKGYIAYLEASPMAKPLYERYGFRQIDSFTLDVDSYRTDKLGQPELYTTFLMLRKPVT